MSQKISQSAFVLLDLLQDIRNAEIKSHVLSNEKDVAYTAKNLINSINRKMNVCLRDFKLLVKPQDMKVFEETVLDDNTLQFANVRNLFFDLSKEDKDKVESFIESLKS